MMNADALVTLVVVGTLGLSSVHRGFAEQSAERVIRYDRNVPIADRLLPSDEVVSVYKMQLEGVTAPRRRESFDAEIKRFRPSEFIGVVRVTATQGELVEGGTWARTKVNATIEQLVRSTSIATGGAVSFGFDGGSTMIGKVAVTAGTFWRFAAGETYLVVLYSNTKGTELIPSVAFRVNANGVLEHIQNNKGKSVTFATNFVGRNVTEVTEALARDQ